MTNAERAADIVAQLKPNTVVRSLRKYHVGEQSIVSHLTEKSVYFTDGSYENKRSMFWYEII